MVCQSYRYTIQSYNTLLTIYYHCIYCTVLWCIRLRWRLMRWMLFNKKCVLRLRITSLKLRNRARSLSSAFLHQQMACACITASWELQHCLHGHRCLEIQVVLLWTAGKNEQNQMLPTLWENSLCNQHLKQIQSSWNKLCVHNKRCRWMWANLAGLGNLWEYLFVARLKTRCGVTKTDC